MDGVTWLEEEKPRRFVSKKELLARRLRASRYYVHRLVAHKYALGVMEGRMEEQEACAAYDEAMRNYDGVIQCADSGNSEKAMEDDMAKGYGAVLEMLEKARA